MRKKPILFICIAIAVLLISFIQCSSPSKEEGKSMQSIKENFIEQRFGMFICYNIMSYGAKWGEANYPIDSFNPQALDCNQWADAAVLAGMKFGLLTTKHHEGFCLWDSKYTNYDVASTPYKKDIVKQYTDAFRKKDLSVGLYYSIWDSTNDVDKESITPKKMDFIKGQITELLSNYGKIDYFVIDGWFWRIGHTVVPYHEIRALIRQLQPDCLITDHTHMQAPYHVEIPYFEGPFGAFPSEDNTMASALGHCSVKGNGWFWDEKTPTGMKANDGLDTIVSKLTACESRYCNFMLNCMPNRDGLLDPIYLDLLKEIGNNWKPNATRPVLPAQNPQMIESIPIQSAKTTSGIAEYLYDGTKIPGKNYYTWESDSVFPQSILIDLGKVYTDVNLINIVPNHRCKPAPETALAKGNITKCELFGSTDNINFTKLATKNWPDNSTYRSLDFEKSQVRYLKLNILDAVGKNAIITELEIGKSKL